MAERQTMHLRWREDGNGGVLEQLFLHEDWCGRVQMNHGRERHEWRPVPIVTTKEAQENPSAGRQCQ